MIQTPDITQLGSDHIGLRLSDMATASGLAFSYRGTVLENYETFDPLVALSLFAAIADSVSKDSGAPDGLGVVLTEDPEASFKLRVDFSGSLPHAPLLMYLYDAVIEYAASQGIEPMPDWHPALGDPQVVPLDRLVSVLDSDDTSPVYLRFKAVHND